MKTLTRVIGLLLLLMFISVKTLFAQDFIIKKNGDELKVKVTEVGTTEIKYKKFDNLETSPVYSILKSEVFMIKYADGSKDVFNAETQTQQQQTETQQTQPAYNKGLDQGTSKSENYKIGQTKIILGTGRSFINSYKVGNLNDFFEYYTTDNRPCDAGSPVLMTFDIGMRNCMDTTGKNWFGAGLQFVITAKHAIWGSEVQYGGGPDVYFNGFFMNLPFTYMHAIDSKKHFFFAVEPAIDMALINGSVTIPSSYSGYDTSYTEAMSFGGGFHVATGIDYVGKFFGVNARLGYRHLKTNEIHYNDKSTTGYSSFYANHIDGATVKVDWSGVFFDIGIYLSLNKKPKQKH
jgi:hypothetical protein